jgi:hypothetical protein
MKIDLLNPTPILRIQYKLLYFKHVPKESGCYVLTSFELDILYIGLSVNLYNRFIQHLGNKTKAKSTTFGKATWFYYKQYNKMNLPKLERTWLNQYLNIHAQFPVFNNVSSPLK